MATEIDVQDLEYVRHATGALLARVFKPRGAGPFPLIVDLHGGAWCRGDRTNDTILNEPLAKSGVVVAALDFRQPPVAAYPASMADINYAIRWLKSRAADFNTRSDMVGVMGISSGGHQGMLNAMRPRDPRYTAVPLPEAPDVDATVRCAILCWPVIDPLGRYQYAKNLKAGGAPYPEVVDRVLPAHDLYWPGEDAMGEASPVRILERGERVEPLPPVLYIQGTKDQAHPRPHLDRFVELYRKAGGQVELELLEGEAEGFISKSPAAAQKTIARIIDFVHKEIG